MNLTGYRNDEKRVRALRKQVEAAIYVCNNPNRRFREPTLNFFTGQKKSIMELAAICGLTYKDGKVG
jgi:hypothetical protein